MNRIILVIALLAKKPTDGNHPGLTEEIERNLKSPKFKVGNCKQSLH